MNPIRSRRHAGMARNVPRGCGRRLGRRGGFGVVEERGGAENGGDDGEEAERDRQRHPGHRQIQRQLRAVEHHAQCHPSSPLLPAPLPASRRPALAYAVGVLRCALLSLEPACVPSRGARGYKGGWAVGWRRSGE
uniref:Uncharacterized protein n=1 Tax=Setaria italica TaxID=4555 RepID=K3ZY04_SETIT